MKSLSSIYVGLLLSEVSALFSAEVPGSTGITQSIATASSPPFQVRAGAPNLAFSGGTPESLVGATPTQLSPVGRTYPLPQLINLSAPVHEPISWQKVSNNVRERPEPPGGLRIVNPSVSSQAGWLAGTWKREKAAAGELSGLVLEPEGMVTLSYASEAPRVEQTIKGRWRAIEQGIRLDFTSQADIPVPREAILSVSHEGAAIVLVGERGVRFAKSKSGAQRKATSP